MTNLQSSKIEELKGGFKGEILLPSDGAYDSARQIWNAMIQQAPCGHRSLRRHIKTSSGR